MAKAEFRIVVVENWQKEERPLTFVSPARKERIPLNAQITAESGEVLPEFCESVTDGSIRPEIWAIEEGSTRNHNVYVARRLLSGKPDIEGYPSGVASWCTPYEKPILINHNLDVDPLGRVMLPEDAKYTRRDGKAGIYLYPTITHPEAIGKVLRKEYKTGSIGVHSDSAICTICQHDIVGTQEMCDHMKGRRYRDGELDPKGMVAEWTLGNLWFQEYSFVNQPARLSSGVTQTNTREALEEMIQRHAKVVFSSEKQLGGKTVCYGCHGETHQCDGKGQCHSEANEFFYIIKLDPPRTHFHVNGTKESDSGSGTAPQITKEEASMVKVQLLPDDLVEAKLTTKSRNQLPDSAFCGPGRSYPAHDAAHVRNGLARLSQFGAKLGSSVRARVLACLRSRAAKFGIKASGKKSEGDTSVTMQVLTGDEALAWIDQYCERFPELKQANESVKGMTEEQLNAMLEQKSWETAEVDGVKEAERGELKAYEEFLAKLPETAFHGPQRTWPAFDSESIQVARAMLSWHSTTEALTDEQRAKIANSLDMLESALKEDGTSDVQLPEWYSREDYVLTAELIEGTIDQSAAAFKTGEQQTCPGGCATHHEGQETDAQKIARLESEISLLNAQKKQLREENAGFAKKTQTLESEVETLRKENSELSANAHSALVEKLVKAKTEAGSKVTAEALRERYAKLPTDTLKHMLDDMETETTASSSSLPPAKPAYEQKDKKPEGSSDVVVEHAGQAGTKAPSAGAQAFSRIAQAVQGQGSAGPRDQS